MITNTKVTTPVGPGDVIGYIGIVDAQGERVLRWLVLLADKTTRWFGYLEAIPL